MTQIHKAFPIVIWIIDQFFPIIDPGRRDKISIQKCRLKHRVFIKLPFFQTVSAYFYTADAPVHLAELHIKHQGNVPNSAVDRSGKLSFVLFYIKQPDKKILFHFLIIIQVFGFLKKAGFFQFANFAFYSFRYFFQGNTILIILKQLFCMDSTNFFSCRGSTAFYKKPVAIWCHTIFVPLLEINLFFTKSKSFHQFLTQTFHKHIILFAHIKFLSSKNINF